MILILGAGLAGLSASYHIGHQKCVILERNSHAYGHIHSARRDGFTWDEGPHVSFTKHDYVRDLFANNVDGEYLEKEVHLTNYWKGQWIQHPAQLHLHSVPEPLRTRCVESFLAQDSNPPPPGHYGEWLDQALGKVFADEFARRYTRKYWTVEAEEMGTSWVGPRVHRPTKEAFLAGANGPSGEKGHYIQKFRYPARGGYQRYAEALAKGARIELGAEVSRIDLVNKQVTVADGRSFAYDRLINTLPLPVFLRMAEGLPEDIAACGEQLRCSKLLVVNVEAKQATPIPNPWLYVYDEEKLSTRINLTELLSPQNTPTGWSGIQVEVYLREAVTGGLDEPQIRKQVAAELKEMGLLQEEVEMHLHSLNVPWANVIFTRETEALLEKIWRGLEPFGLEREAQDTHPLTDWTKEDDRRAGSLLMAGRFGQWKYFWTDDCVLRGRQLAAAK